MFRNCGACGVPVKSSWYMCHLERSGKPECRELGRELKAARWQSPPPSTSLTNPSHSHGNIAGMTFSGASQPAPFLTDNNDNTLMDDVDDADGSDTNSWSSPDSENVSTSMDIDLNEGYIPLDDLDLDIIVDVDSEMEDETRGVEEDLDIASLPFEEEFDFVDPLSTPEPASDGEVYSHFQPFVLKYRSDTDPGTTSPTERKGLSTHDRYHASGGRKSNPYLPFKSRIDWEVARWAKLRGPSSTAVSELFAIEGLVDALGLSYKSMDELNSIIDKQLPGRPHFRRYPIRVKDEVYEVYFRDIMGCIESIYGDPDLAPYLVHAPERHFVDENQTSRLIHDMHTADWWWETQLLLDAKKGKGRTIIPLIFSSDQTQLTSFKGKAAYPLYMTLGNIPKEIRRKPSFRAYVLLAYLPADKLKHITDDNARRAAIINLYHTCVSRIYGPLSTAGLDGTEMRTGDGTRHHCHPIHAAFSGDYPEQALATGIYRGECPQCDAEPDGFCDFHRPERPYRELKRILDTVQLVDKSLYLETCNELGVKPITNPFWKDLPFTNIYQSITPDILHQLYQGLVKHMVKWVSDVFGSAEIDARCQRLPPNHNIRVFMKGITSLTRVTGREHRQMSQFLLGLVLDIRLQSNWQIAITRAIRGLLDFVYLAQYPIHTTETLELMTSSLQQFDDHKHAFIELGVRQTFDKIPKLHFARHYVRSIKLYGSPDNFNTEYTERLHVDLAKDAYRATNHKDEFIQMTQWLERREQILRHEQYVLWRIQGKPPILRVDWIPPGLDLTRYQKIARYPNAKSVNLRILQTIYGARHFEPALARFIALKNEPQLTSVQLADRLTTIEFPTTSFHVWHLLKFVHQDPISKAWVTADSIHVRPPKRDTQNRLTPARFDTALIDIREPSRNNQPQGIKGYRVGQIRVIFSLHRSIIEQLVDPGVQMPTHLAYVEWFSTFGTPNTDHGMYPVSRSRLPDRTNLASVVPISSLHSSIHLLPRFGPVAPREWTSSTVLGQCDNFVVNPFTSPLTYRILS